MDDDRTVLLSGVASGAAFGLGPASLPAQFAATARGLDTKNPVLMSYFGLHPGTPMLFGGLIITGPPIGGIGGGGFSVPALDVDFPNTPTPEPASLLLLGAGIGGAFLRKWRSMSR